MNAYELEAKALLSNRPRFAREVARQVYATQFDKLASFSTGGLTARQRDLLLFIRRHVGEHGIAPSFDEMKAELELASKSGVHRMILALEERGFIARIPDRARAIRLVAS